MLTQQKKKKRKKEKKTSFLRFLRFPLGLGLSQPALSVSLPFLFLFLDLRELNIDVRPYYLSPSFLVLLYTKCDCIMQEMDPLGIAGFAAVCVC